jgi:hypothetical protein
VGRGPHDAAATTDGTIVITNEQGGGVVFVRDGAVAPVLFPHPRRSPAVGCRGQYAAVADVQGTAYGYMTPRPASWWRNVR